MTAAVMSVALSGCVLNLGGKVLRLGPGASTAATATKQAVAQQQAQPDAQPSEEETTSTPARAPVKEPTPREKAAVPGKEAAAALRAALEAADKSAPIDAAVVQTMEDKAREAEALLPGAGEYYLHQATWLRAAAALQQNDAASVASQLGGALTSNGDAGRELTAAIKAKPDTCYTVVGLFRAYTGVEKVASREVEGPASLRAYTVDVKPKALVTQGFCATSAATHTVRIKSSFAGTSNGLRYAVVEHPRAALPMVVARSLDLELPDRCDADAWETAVLKPIPGTIGWRGRELSLILNNELGNNSANCAWLIDNGSRLSMGRMCFDDIGDFAAKPAEGALVFPPFALNRCPGKSETGRLPRGEVSRKLLACEATIEKKYEKAWDEVDARRRAADRRSTASFKWVDTGAEAKAEQLRAAWDKDYAKLCKPLYTDARAKVEARYNKIVDALRATPVEESSGRAQANGRVIVW